MDEVRSLVLDYLELCGISSGLRYQLDAELQHSTSKAEDSLLFRIYRYVKDRIVDVQVSSLAGKSCTVQASASTTVLDLKAAVGVEMGVSVRDQCLLAGSDVMQDASKICDYGITPLSPPLCVLNVCHAKLLVMGGVDEAFDTLDHVDLFDPMTGSWSVQGSMGKKRKLSASAVLNGKPCVLGGEDENELVLESVEVFDPCSNTWSSLPSMTVRRAAHAVAVLRERMYVFGGYDDEERVLEKVESFDPVVGCWVRLRSMSLPRERLAAAALGDDSHSICIVGGSDHRGIPLSSAEVLDTRAYSWSALPPMSTPRAALAATVVEGRLCVAGGFDEQHQGLATVEIYDFEARAWASIPPMICSRIACTATSLGGQLYVVGGCNKVPHNTQVFNFQRGTWESLPSGTKCRKMHTAVAANLCL